MHLLEPRANPSRLMRWAGPPIAILLTLISASILFALLGKPPAQAFYVFFIEPLETSNGWSELALKASPLVLIGLGLALGFRARVYNIGAEGQLLMGAVFASGVAIYTDGIESAWILPAMIFAGALGGALWGAVPALLKTRFNAEETLTTLMLTYVASYLLSYLVSGPWRDPGGTNFPQSILFSESAMFAPIFEGLRLNSSIVITLIAVPLFWLFVSRSFRAYQLTVGGLEPAAARYAGFSSKASVWTGLLVSGAAAGLAGAMEAAGPVGQLTLSLSPGYGYAAIIVAWVGRLHPVGILLAGLLLALIYIGGEAAQVSMQLPSAIAWLFQGMLLFFLLGVDVFVDYRFRKRREKRFLPKEGEA